MKLIFNYLKPYIVFDDDISLNKGTTIKLVEGIKYMIVKHDFQTNNIQIQLGYKFHHTNESSTFHFFHNFIDSILVSCAINKNNTYFYQLVDDFTLTHVEDIFLTYYPSVRYNKSESIYVSKELSIIYISCNHRYTYSYDSIINNKILFKKKIYSFLLNSMNMDWSDKH